MTIDEAIRSRYDRFNALWLKATGHTFEEDEQWCKDENKKQMAVWKKKIKPILRKYGFPSVEQYESRLKWEDCGSLGWRCVNNIEEIDEIIREKPSNESLFGYEKFCIDEAKLCAEWVIENKDLDWWNENAGKKTYEIVNRMKENGFNFSEEHSGNTMGTAILMADCLLRRPEWFKFLHGALSPLVGDAGYYDDRSDVKEAMDKEEKESQTK